MTDHYDVIVIGSGAGGGTLTHALAPTGKRILLRERGDCLPREPQNWDSKSVWVDLRYHNSGNWTDDQTGEEFAPKQNYYVGGNTKVYGAILFRFRERDFGEIAHADGSAANQSLVSDASAPSGLALDGSHVYWANSGSNTVTMPTGTWTYVPAAASAKSTSATGSLTLCSVNPAGSPSNGLCQPTASAGW